MDAPRRFSVKSELFARPTHRAPREDGDNGRLMATLGHSVNGSTISIDNELFTGTGSTRPAIFQMPSFQFQQQIGVGCVSHFHFRPINSPVRAPWPSYWFF